MTNDRGSYPTVRELVETIIGYPIIREHEQEIKETIKWFEFEHGPPYRIERNIPQQMINLYVEGALSPTHRIPQRVLELIDAGETPYVYICEECLAEAKENRYSILEEAPKEMEAFLKWMNNNLDRVVASGGIPYSELGRAIVFRIEHEDYTQRTKFCTRPDSPHHLIETIPHGSPTTTRKEE